MFLAFKIALFHSRFIHGLQLVQKTPCLNKTHTVTITKCEPTINTAKQLHQLQPIKNDKKRKKGKSCFIHSNIWHFFAKVVRNPFNWKLFTLTLCCFLLLCLYDVRIFISKRSFNFNYSMNACCEWTTVSQWVLDTREKSH